VFNFILLDAWFNKGYFNSTLIQVQIAIAAAMLLNPLIKKNGMSYIIVLNLLWSEKNCISEPMVCSLGSED
jgi:hypothetical protein